MNDPMNVLASTMRDDAMRQSVRASAEQAITAVFIGRDPVPGVLRGTGRNSAGLFQFTLDGDAGATYGIEVSGDLIHWSPRTNLLNNGGLLQFIDADSPNFPHRYYRTVVTAP